MPQIDINYWAVLAAAVSTMIIGYVWYGPLFGKQWQKLSNVTVSPEMAKKGMGSSMVIAFIGSLLMAFVLKHALVFAIIL